METDFKPMPEKIDKEAGYIKLMKSSTSKGVVYYAWDIKVVEGRSKEEYEALVKIVEDLNKLMGVVFYAEGGS